MTTGIAAAAATIFREDVNAPMTGGITTTDQTVTTITINS